MKQKYDFARSVHSNSFREKTETSSPVYLDNEVQNYLQKRAKSKGVKLAQLVNEMLRQEIKLIEAVKP